MYRLGHCKSVNLASMVMMTPDVLRQFPPPITCVSRATQFGSRFFHALQLNEIRVNEFPINQLVNEGIKIVASSVLVIKVIRMLPDVHCQ